MPRPENDLIIPMHKPIPGKQTLARRSPQERDMQILWGSSTFPGNGLPSTTPAIPYH